MKRYAVQSWKGEAPDIAGKTFEVEKQPFCRLPFAQIAAYPWPMGDYRPEARAYVAQGDSGLIVLMCANEPTVSAAQTQFGGAVCRDSCLEFFLNPRPSLQREYINVEVNCAGVMHIGFGEGRENRRVLSRMPEGVAIQHSLHRGAWWAVCYTLPFSLIGRCEREMRGNFYTCDESLHEHYGTWSPVKAAHPDFHRPECFGSLHLED